jgi:cation diffusion facilitator CzcD-associated flavoprotein CzcO
MRTSFPKHYCNSAVVDTARSVVIGGGISGLVTTKVLSAAVWAPSRTYPGLRASSPRDFCRFSDFPYPESTSNSPAAQEVRDYLHACVERFGLGERLQRTMWLCATACSHSPTFPR